MTDGDGTPASPEVLAGSWQAAMFLGAATLIIGITWIVQGLAALIGGISGGVREGRAWWIVFGAASLIAGIAVVAAPASSLNVLATLLGIWFMVMGVFEIIGGLLLRHALHAREMTHA